MGDPASDRGHAHGGAEPYLRIGRYALFDALAAGGMATVHIGRLLGPVGFSRTVAIKRLHPNLAWDEGFTTMLGDEARLASRVRHPNVVPILDVVQTEGELFLVMEYVQGVSLGRVMQLAKEQNELAPIPVALAIVCGALCGLHAAHEAKSDSGEPLGMVHRDVSPQNIMVGVDGIPRVVDFGIAKASGRMQSTMAGQVKGKLAYMAPEQVCDGEIDRRADIYAAGVVMWQLLTGRRLYRFKTDTELMARVLEGARVPPREYRPEIPAALDAVVMRALARKPAERFATARDFALALEACVPLASPLQTGSWIDQVASGDLAERALLVGGVESQPGILASAAGSDEPLSSGTRSVTPTQREATERTQRSLFAGAPDSGDAKGTERPTTVPARHRSRTRAPWIVALTLLGAGLAFAFMRQAATTETRAPGAPDEAARAASQDAPERASEMDEASRASASTEATPSAAPSDAGAASAQSGARATTSTATTRPGTHPPLAAAPVYPPLPQVPRAPPPTAPAPPPPPPTAVQHGAKNCDPPYWIDNRGVQRLKPDCL